METSMNPEPAKLALSVADVCHACSIGRSTFYEEVKAGRIRVLKAGKRTLIATGEVQRWLDSLASDEPTQPRRSEKPSKGIVA